jgi:lipoprotein-anchoring transpeptidase ErfK/SrfK
MHFSYLQSIALGATLASLSISPLAQATLPPTWPQIAPPVLRQVVPQSISRTGLEIILQSIPQTLIPPQGTAIAAPLRLEISLTRRQLSLFQGPTVMKRYSVAVGRSGWETPIGQFQIKQMILNPAWKNPFNGSIIPGGDPENPLGRHWIGFWTDGKNWVGLHGTPNPNSVGRAVSHGCVRMYNQDIADVFRRVTPGTPIKVGR